MKIVYSFALFLLVLCTFVVYDYNSYDKKTKIKDIQANAKFINFHKVEFNFKSNHYKEFVYAK